jgi:hypothetical protein
MVDKLNITRFRLEGDTAPEIQAAIAFLRLAVEQAGGELQISPARPGRKGGYLAYGTLVTGTRVVKVDPTTGGILE